MIFIDFTGISCILSFQLPFDHPRLHGVKRQASHEALFNGSFCTVMPQMGTPCAWHKDSLCQFMLETTRKIGFPCLNYSVPFFSCFWSLWRLRFGCGAPNRTESIWRCSWPKLAPCHASNMACQNGPSPGQQRWEQMDAHDKLVGSHVQNNNR